MQSFVILPRRKQTGRTAKVRLYIGQYRLEGDPKPTRVPLHTSEKRVAEEKLRQLVHEKELERAGLVPARTQQETAQKPIQEHLVAFLEAKTETRDARYLYELKNRVLKLAKECAWNAAKDISPEAFITWRKQRREEHGNSNKTLNEYLLSIRALLNWMAAKRRILSNPLQSVEMLPTRDRQVRPRRALSHDEVCALLQVAGERRIIYLTAAMTGLRRGELAQLLPADILLDGPKAWIMARATTTKNGKRAAQPVHEQLAKELRAFLQSKALPAGTPVFADLLPEMDQFKADLTAAGIPFLDEQGRRADFHSLRHTFATSLQIAGVGQRELMDLMRHSERRLSDSLYTDSNLLPVVQAVERIPAYLKTDAQIAAHAAVFSGPTKSQLDTIAKNGDEQGALINRDLGHDQSGKVPSSHEEKDGARYRVRTCDPYRVKVVLYH